MKKIIALFLCSVIFLTACTPSRNDDHNHSVLESELETTTTISTADIINPSGIHVEDTGTELVQFSDLGDPDLLQYVEDSVYAELAYCLESDYYTIENITASYISQEYLDEVAFNSQSNIYFGYTIAELDAHFQGTRYVFTLGENGQTSVQEMQVLEDASTEEILKNIAIGTGVILICVAVSYFTAGTATPTAVNLIFTAAAKTGTTFALSSAAFGGISAGVIRGVETGDMSEALEAAANSGSEAFKWGAITGVITGGFSEILSIYRSTKTIPTYRQSELDVLNKTDGAVEQVSYLNGERVSSSTLGSTRPDVVVQNADGTVKAIEVKNYNLNSPASRSILLNELERQVTSRKINLPKGSTQEIVLDCRGRGYSTSFIESFINTIRERLNDVYYNIPIRVMRYSS